MASAFAIISEIKSAMRRSGHPPWHFGITNDPAERQKYWGVRHHTDLGRWQEWEADSLSDARSVEGYFSGDRMLEGGTGGSLRTDQAIFVYIF